jgi:hypothetical protein
MDNSGLKYAITKRRHWGRRLFAGVINFGLEEKPYFCGEISVEAVMGAHSFVHPFFLIIKPY